MVGVLRVLVAFSWIWAVSSAHAAHSSVWSYFSNHVHTPASTHPVGLSFLRGINFGDEWDFIEALDDSGRVVRYSRTERVLQLIQFSTNGSFQVLQEATNVGPQHDTWVLGASGHELMAIGEFGAHCDTGLCPNVAFYNRVTRSVHFWSVRDAYIMPVSSTTNLNVDAEGLAVGDWDKTRPGDEIILYDKFAGKLHMFSAYTYTSYSYNALLRQWSFTTTVHTSRIREQSWAANFERLLTLDRDGDGTPELWFFNSDRAVAL